MKECHTCVYNGKCSDECLKCISEEQYSYKFNHYILDTYDAPEPEVQ